MPASPRGYLLVGLVGFGCGFATAERIYATDSERSRVAFIGECIATSASGDFLQGSGTYLREQDDGTAAAAARRRRRLRDDGGDDDDAAMPPAPPRAGHKELVSCTAGEVVRTNKLVSVRGVRGRYGGQVGDLVVGRVKEVGAKRWKVDIGASRDAGLGLSAVNFDSGDLRVRTDEDSLQMRNVFCEGDLISAEVQNVTHGLPQLHTRNYRYGKLENGVLVHVPPHLVRRRKEHFCRLDCPGGAPPVDMLLGMNGAVWLTRAMPEAWGGGADGDEADSAARKPELARELKARHASMRLLPSERASVCRCRNSVVVLRTFFRPVAPETILKVYARSLELELGLAEMLSSGAALLAGWADVE